MSKIPTIVQMSPWRGTASPFRYVDVLGGGYPESSTAKRALFTLARDQVRDPVPKRDRGTGSV